LLKNILMMRLTYLIEVDLIAQHHEHIMHRIKQCGPHSPKDEKIWRHLAIIKHFVRGYWIKPDYPKTGTGLLENKRLPLRRLYSYRIKSDYDGVNVDYHVLEQLLEVVKQIINIIQGKEDK